MVSKKHICVCNDNNYEFIVEFEKDTSDFSLEGGARQLKFCINETFTQ
jgi:hypothetical protein